MPVRLKKFALLFVLAFVPVCRAEAGTDGDRSISFSGAYGTLFNTEGILNSFVSGNGCMSYSVRYAIGTNPDSRNADFAEIFNYPTFGIGANWSRFSTLEFKNDSWLGDVVDLYGFIESYFYKNSFLSLGMSLDFGASVNNCAYDVVKNPRQYLLGANMSVYASFGPQISFRPWKRAEISVRGYWNHHSNGHTWMPNYGLNGLAVSGTLRYYIDEPYTEQVSVLRKKTEFDKGFRLNAFLSYGMHASRTEFEAFNLTVDDPALKQTSFRSYPRPGLGIEGEYRYSAMFSTGAVVDINYNSDTPALRKADEKLYGKDKVKGLRYDPLNIGLGFIHEIHYRNVSAFCGVSYYLYRHSGINEERLLYQRAGMRFRFPNFHDMFLAWCIRAHRFNDADYFEFQIGIPLV